MTKKALKKAKNKLKEQPKETVLLVVVGTTPAVLTETVWALCAQDDIPGDLRVIPISTGSTADRIQDELHTPLEDHGGKTIWQSLREEIQTKFKIKPKRLCLEDVEVIKIKNEETGRTDKLEDIRSKKDN